MTRLRLLIGIVGIAAVVQESRAAVSAEEAKQLGTTLTEFGAEKAGNADGSIPAYTGGLTTPPPANFKPGTGRYPDPFAEEKPLFSIDAKNMAQYSDALTEGAKELMRRHADFRLDVYPTHRTVSYPKYVIDRCAKNAIDAKLTNSGNGLTGDPHACVPFPIPKSGLEVLWNHTQRNTIGDKGQLLHLSTWVVDASGRRSDGGGMFAPYYSWYHDSSISKLGDLWTAAMMGDFTRPAAQAGEKQILKYSIDYDKQDARAWIYTPGQRRVRLAPEFTYDTPIASTGGIQFYDEVYAFAGKPDRFEWKLVGKKELYIPYNTYRLAFELPPEKAIGPKNVNPDANRWEKHRVWVVEATLKPGKRHAYQRRTFYFDEDSWAIVAVDAYDHAGKLQKVGFEYVTPIYDATCFVTPHQFIDMNKGAYIITVLFDAKENFVNPHAKVDPGMFTPDRMAAAGVR